MGAQGLGSLEQAAIWARHTLTTPPSHQGLLPPLQPKEKHSPGQRAQVRWEGRPDLLTGWGKEASVAEVGPCWCLAAGTILCSQALALPPGEHTQRERCRMEP